MAQLIEKKRLVGILRGFGFAKVQRVMEQTDAKWLREDGREIKKINIVKEEL